MHHRLQPVLLLALVSAAAAGCGPTASSSVGVDETTDEEAADDDRVDGDDTDAAFAPYEACDAYLSCQDDLGLPVAVLTEQLGPEGSCWLDSDPDLCAAICADGLTALQMGSWEGLPSSCLHGVSDAEIVARAHELCPEAPIPSEALTPEATRCLADIVTSCPIDAAVEAAVCVDDFLSTEGSFRSGRYLPGHDRQHVVHHATDAALPTAL